MNPFSGLTDIKGPWFSSSGLLRTCILRSIISEFCLNSLGLSIGRFNSVPRLPLGLIVSELSILLRKGEIRRSLSFLSAGRVRGAKGGRPSGCKRLEPVPDPSFRSDALFSLLSIDRSSSSLSILVFSTFFVFSSDVRSS